ncbi:MAG: hypothetical protein HON32_04680 [Francisellaceae bacterium]|jgi:insulysin|nr:hypothetical protein [Francisellaceae bacterium]MBT6538204.1 hypothetical protein [Francisellaceae bacterium]
MHNYISKFYKTFTMIALMAFLSCCQDATNNDITKSSNDINQYKHLTLSNGLKVVLVNYPETEKAAAVLTVGVGSFDDPKSRAGLAHYLEHMLFLGTEKYPKPDEYHEFMSKHGGHDNAFTASENTTYLFDINADQLEEGLDRFAQFFISPLFTEEYVERERNAVDSEYKMHMKNDGMRIYHGIKQIINPQHPMAAFSVGNLETLHNQNNSLRKEVKRFYDDKYDASKMYLAIVGPQNLEILQSYAENMFSGIQTKCPCTTIDGVFPEILTKDEIKKNINIKSLNDAKSLSMIFKIPNQVADYKDNPAKYVEYILGTSTPGSLYTKLKDKNYISGLSIGINNIGKTDALFEIEFTLTDQGFTHKSMIMQDTFDYIDWVKKHGVQKWLFEQQKKVEIRSFKFSERVQPLSLATNLSTLLREYPAKDLLTVYFLQPESQFPENKIKSLLDTFTPNNLVILNVDSEVDVNKKEKYFGTEYKIDDIDINLFTTLNSKRTTDWMLPKENIFLPENFDIVTSNEKEKLPILVSADNDIKIWKLNLERFNNPRTELILSLKTPLVSDSAEYFIMAGLFTLMINDNLTEYATILGDAGISIGNDTTRTGLTINISAYRDNIDRALSLSLMKFMKSDLSMERFASIKTILVDSLNNYKNAKSFQMAISEHDSLLIKGNFSNTELLTAINNVDYNKFVKYTSILRSSVVDVTALIEGNINEQNTQLIEQLIAKYIRINKQLNIPKIKNVSIPEKTMYWEVHPTDKDSNVLISYYPIDKSDYITKAKLMLLGNVISTPFFDELRTTQQVGYVVAARADSSYKQLGVQFIIQSPNYKQRDLLHRVDKFISDEYDQIKTLPERELEEHKSSIYDNLLDKPKDISSSLGQHWNILSKEDTDFDRNEKIAELVMKISKDELLEFYKEVLITNDKHLLIVNDTHDLIGIDKIESIRGLN